MKRVIGFLGLLAMASAAFAQTAGVYTDAAGNVQQSQGVTIVGGTITAPTGAATSAKQDTGNASLSAIDVDTSTIITNLGSPYQAGGALPLPSGAATLAAQTAAQAPVTPATATATSTILMGCAYNSTLPTFTNTQQGSMQCGTRGALNVTLFAADSSASLATTNNSSDAVGTAGTVISVGSFTKLFTGSAWALARSVSASTDSVGTGIAAAGMVGQCDDTTPTQITENQFGNARITCNTRAIITRPYESQVNSWIYAAASGGISNTTTAVTFKAADATRKICITGFSFGSGALGAGTEVAIRDGAGGTVLWRDVLTTSGGEIKPSLHTPICGTAATLMEVVTLTATITGAVYFNAQGYLAL